jgi:hypothetical protein
MKKETFDTFLRYVHAKLSPDLLDDELPNYFDNWVSERNTDELIEWAEIWGERQYLMGKSYIINKM